MIKLFSVKNYRNFKDEITLDFSNIREEYNFNTYCIKEGLLSKVMIYGHNGVGKSNLGFALFDIMSVLTDKHLTKELKSNVLFLNADSKEKAAHFHYEFLLDGNEIIFEYEKVDFDTLLSESLIINGKIVYSYYYERNFFEVNNLQMINADTLNFEFFENNISILKYVANNSNINSMPYIKSIIAFVNGMLWFRSLDINQFTGFHPNEKGPMDDIINTNSLVEFSDYLKRLTGQTYKFEPYISETSNRKRILEIHENRKIDFMQAASSGTKTLTLLYAWMLYFEKASFVWMDEFDAFYHFELSKGVVEEILKYENIQVVFTSHNTYLLDNELLRPDAYLILKDSKVHNLPDSTIRELREGHDLEQLYRNGDFEDE